MIITATAPTGTKYYALLGRLLTQREPETAQRIISTYLPTEQPIETDLSKISHFFQLFCSIRDIKPEDYTGPLYKSSKVDERRLFISVILRLYAPNLYSQPLDGLILSHGIIKQLSLTLGCDQGNISRMIRQAVTWEKNYRDFAEVVETIVNQITEDGSTKG